MRRRPTVALLVSAALAAGMAPAACRPPAEAVIVQSDRVSVLNQTDADWTDMELRVNRYYVVRVARLTAGGRFDAPVTRLQGGFGRYFDPARERVRSVEVSATGAAGQPVRLEWRDTP